MSNEISLPKIWVSGVDSIDIPRQVEKTRGPDCDSGPGLTPVEFDENRARAYRERLSLGQISSLSLSKDIYLAPVEDNFVIVSASGSHVVVLDSQAAQILALVDSPISRTVLFQSLPWPRIVTEQIIAVLLVEGILLAPREMELLPTLKIYNESSTLTAWLHLTNGCNLSCQYCYLALDGKKMSLETAYHAVDSIFRSALIHRYSCVQLKYAGGEPTLNFKVLLAAQQYAERRSGELGIALETVILTNGVKLTSTQIDELIIHDIRVAISLDGLGEFHDTQRSLAKSQRGSYERVAHTIDTLVKRGIRPHISITITNKNLKGLPALVEALLIKDLRFSFSFFREPDDSLAYQDLSMTSDRLIPLLLESFRVIEQRLPPYSLLSNLSDRADLRMPHLYTCGVGRHYMVINQDGGIAKCQMEIQSPVTAIHVEDPLVVLRADSRGLQNLSVDEKECHGCVWRYRCTGGCPRVAFQRTGRFDAKSPMCEIYEAILPEIVRLEALRLVRYERPLRLMVE